MFFIEVNTQEIITIHAVHCELQRKSLWTHNRVTQILSNNPLDCRKTLPINSILLHVLYIIYASNDYKEWIVYANPIRPYPIWIIWAIMSVANQIIFGSKLIKIDQNWSKKIKIDVLIAWMSEKTEAPYSWSIAHGYGFGLHLL